MNDGIETFRSQLQKELGLSIGPKDPLMALWVSQKVLLKQNTAQQQKLLSEFQVALGRNQTAWSEQAKALAQQSLNAGLRAAQDSTALLLEEAGRVNGAAVRKAFEEGVTRMEQTLADGRRIAWVSLAASIVAPWWCSPPPSCLKLGKEPTTK
jgi:Transcriptional activator TraM